MSAIGSGSPRWNTSRCSCGRPISWPATSRNASSRFSRQASALAMSSAVGPSGVAGLRQQQPRFQIGEPRRHHQIVGGELEPQLPRLLDEGEVLLGQRQDRNLGEIDLLLAGQRQQQVERAFEALDVDDQRRLVGAAVGQFRSRMPRLRSSGGPGRHHGGELASRRRQDRSPTAACAQPAPRRRGARPRRTAPAPRRPPPASRRSCRCNGAPCRSRPRATPARARRSIPTARPSKRRRSSAARRIR